MYDAKRSQNLFCIPHSIHSQISRLHSFESTQKKEKNPRRQFFKFLFDTEHWVNKTKKNWRIEKNGIKNWKNHFVFSEVWWMNEHLSDQWFVANILLTFAFIFRNCSYIWVFFSNMRLSSEVRTPQAVWFVTNFSLAPKHSWNIWNIITSKMRRNQLPFQVSWSQIRSKFPFQ